MKLTNKKGLPAALVNAVEKMLWTNKFYSITSMQKTPRHFWIEKNHFDEIEVDVSDCLWLLMGTALHKILDDGTDKNVTEKALSFKIQDDLEITGVTDLYDGGWLSDWKSTSAWSLVYKDRLPEWEEQLNGYSYLLRQNGYKPKGLRVFAMLKDWSETNYKRDPQNYPDSDFQKIEFKQWSFEQQDKHFREKALALYEYRNDSEYSLPECDFKYKWQDPTKYAVMKEGRKTALKLHPSEIDAENHVQTVPNGYIQKRPSIPKRCVKYCRAAKFCSQHQEWLDNGGRDLLNA